MNKVVTGVIVVIGVGVGGLLAVASTKPDVAHVERSITLDATAADLLPYATDFNEFVQWNPWAKRDPNQTVEVSDPSNGVGAWYTWSGNSDVGKGRMDQTSIKDGEVIHHLTFIEPFTGEADTAIRWVEQGDSLKVTWSYDGEADLLTKVMDIFMPMETLLGNDFEAGLASLKPRVEGAAEARKQAEREAEAARAIETTSALEITGEGDSDLVE